MSYRAVIIVLGLLATVVGCENAKRQTEFEPRTLGGQEVTAEQLNVGHEAYMMYCYACHGEQGDATGPAALGLRPPPRDFGAGVYKFGGVVDGLPHDEDFARIIEHGLTGTAMRPWRMPPKRLDGVIQYIKTFSEVWSDPDEELGKQVVPKDDPYAGDAEKGIKRGKKVYHGFATCWSCHPAYATKQEIYDASTEWNKDIVDFRPRLYDAEIKQSEFAVAKHLSDPREEIKVKILPPDFLYHRVRTAREGTEVEDLFRTIGAGIPGTAMPAWYGSIKDDDLWAMAYYVKSLMDIRDTDEASKLHKKMQTQPAFVPPAKDEPEPPAEGETEGADAEAGDTEAAEGDAEDDEGGGDAKDDAKDDVKDDVKPAKKKPAAEGDHAAADKPKKKAEPTEDEKADDSDG